MVFRPLHLLNLYGRGENLRPFLYRENTCMTPNKQFNKILSWAMIALPIIFMLYLVYFLFLFSQSENRAVVFSINNLILFQIGFLALGLMLVIPYFVHLGKNKHLSSSEKTQWTWRFLHFGPFGMIYYWSEYVNPLKFKD